MKNLHLKTIKTAARDLQLGSSTLSGEHQFYNARNRQADENAALWSLYNKMKYCLFGACQAHHHHHHHHQKMASLARKV